jgi:hypothetical protein
MRLRDAPPADIRGYIDSLIRRRMDNAEHKCEFETLRKKDILCEMIPVGRKFSAV